MTSEATDITLPKPRLFSGSFVRSAQFFFQEYTVSNQIIIFSEVILNDDMIARTKSGSLKILPSGTHFDHIMIQVDGSAFAENNSDPESETVEIPCLTSIVEDVIERIQRLEMKEQRITEPIIF
jgi:hypothetical protein